MGKFCFSNHLHWSPSQEMWPFLKLDFSLEKQLIMLKKYLLNIGTLTINKNILKIWEWTFNSVNMFTEIWSYSITVSLTSQHDEKKPTTNMYNNHEQCNNKRPMPTFHTWEILDIS